MSNYFRFLLCMPLFCFQLAVAGSAGSGSSKGQTLALCRKCATFSAKRISRTFTAQADTILARYQRYLYSFPLPKNIPALIGTYAPATQWADIDYSDNRRA